MQLTVEKEVSTTPLISNANTNNNNNREVTPPLPPKQTALVKPVQTPPQNILTDKRKSPVKPQRQASFGGFEGRRPKPPVPTKPSTLNRAQSMQVRPGLIHPSSPLVKFDKRRQNMSQHNSKLVPCTIPLLPNMEVQNSVESNV